MKEKVCIISITILLIILAAGCQLTPEKAIVSAKNQDDMLKMAMEPNEKGQMSLPEAYDIPKEYHNELLLAEGKLVCTINAPVLAPNVTHIPIVRVTGVDFAESELVTMAKVFFGETPIYKIPGTYQMTKSEIEESILYYKQLMKDLYGESAPEHPEVEALEKLYQTAPDTYIPELWDGMIWTEPLIIAGKDYGKEKKLQLQGDLGKNESARFSVIFNPEFTETIVPDSELYSALSVYTGASVSFANMDDNEALFYANSKKISSLDEIPSQAVGALQMKPRDALNIAQACLDSIGAKNLLPVGDVYLMSAFDENSQKTNCAYKLHFSSGFKGIPAAYIGKLETGGFGSTIVEDGTYDKYWDYETLQLLINDTGILYFKWTSPHEIGDTLVENAKLLSFNEIQSIFEKMIRNQYEAVVKEGLQYIEEIGINVDLVQLGFMRTIEQNSIEQGLMVPAWLFYGTRTDTMSQEYIDMGGVPEEYYGVKEPLCLMAINAVDGSIIDSTKGY